MEVKLSSAMWIVIAAVALAISVLLARTFAQTPQPADVVEGEPSPVEEAVLIVVDGRPLIGGAPYPASYFGGLPSLPDDVTWPVFQESETRPPEAMTFLAQVDLASLPVRPAADLPEDGALLFFSYTQFDALPQGDQSWARVIYVPADQLSDDKRAAPDNITAAGDMYSRPWIEQGSTPATIAPRYAARWLAVPRHQLGTTANTVALQALLDEALPDDARRAFETVDYRGPELPVIWREVSMVVDGYRNNFSSFVDQPGYRSADQLPLFDAMTAEPDEAAQFFLEARELYREQIERLDQLALQVAAKGAWTPLTEEEQRDAMEQLQAAVAVHDRLDARRESDGWGRSWQDRYVRFPYPIYDFQRVERAMQAVRPFAVVEMIETGEAPDSVYAQNFVDTVVPRRGVRNSREMIEAALSFPDQMFGNPDIVQHAGYEHADKVLLLELHGRPQYPWHGPIDCALQYWIAADDLRNRRFDFAFATLECG